MKYSFRERFRYWFDNMMARGSGVLILWLFMGAVAMILFVAFMAWLTPDQRNTPLTQLIWASMLRTLDPGTMGGDTGSWGFLFLMFGITLGGIFVVGTLVGIITNGIDDKLDELRKGRSIVIEKDHTVILGWSQQIFSIISELIIANENRKNACIAILANKDKIEMDDQIRNRIGKTENTRIVTRSGDPIDLNDLDIINIHTARSIIVLSPDSGNPDAEVLKSVLAVTNNPKRKQDKYHIVASLKDPGNLEAAGLITEDEAEFLLVNDLTARIMARTCRQSGMSLIYHELMDFAGDEIYFASFPEMKGITFGDLLFRFDDSSVLGIFNPAKGVHLNPPMDTRLESSDQVIAISRDDDTVIPSSIIDYAVDEAAIHQGVPEVQKPDHTLILGWNLQGPAVIENLDFYAQPGSIVVVVTDQPEQAKTDYYSYYEAENIKVEFRMGDIASQRTLSQIGINDFNQVIALSDTPRLKPQQADALTMITLLQLRKIAQENGKNFTITSEMLDVRNRELAEVAEPDDFIVSEHLISLLLAQISENKNLMPVFDDLLNPEGSEIYIKPANDYVELEHAVNFYTVVESARRRSQVAIGYRLKSETEYATHSYGIYLNPVKSKPVTFTNGDQIIVLSET
jgi:voltage-gated potassium channel Kch